MRSVAFGVPADVAFDYLIDPRNRPEWQSSLRRVELLDDEVRVGQRWVDVTAPGLRPAMETTRLERPTTWTERGVWRRITADLTLTFTPAGHGCLVTAEATVTGRGVVRPLGPLVAHAAALVVPHDLERAAILLSERASGH